MNIIFELSHLMYNIIIIKHYTENRKLIPKCKRNSYQAAKNKLESVYFRKKAYHFCKYIKKEKKA